MVERDEEHYARETLKLMPTAAAAWKGIVAFYFEHQRWPEANTAARAYLEVYPHDYDFALYAGGELAANSRYTEGIPLLELVVERKPSYEAYQALGWALSYAGNNLRAAQVLEASLALDPQDFQAYYHLGYVYTGLNRYADAIAMFEKVLERQPNMPEANAEITKLRRLLATQQQTGERKK
jgi:tetratricopeptide (TPR) repeat protein